MSTHSAVTGHDATTEVALKHSCSDSSPAAHGVPASRVPHREPGAFRRIACPRCSLLTEPVPPNSLLRTCQRVRHSTLRQHRTGPFIAIRTTIPDRTFSAVSQSELPQLESEGIVFAASRS